MGEEKKVKEFTISAVETYEDGTSKKFLFDDDDPNSTEKVAGGFVLIAIDKDHRSAMNIIIQNMSIIEIVMAMIENEHLRKAAALVTSFANAKEVLNRYSSK